jgi:peptidoglycan-associated lipoprotein
MNWKKILLSGLVLPVMAVGLIACSNKPGAEAGDDSTAAADSESYPLYSGDASRGGEKRDASGFIINEMTAPSNQTYYFKFDNSQVFDSDLAAIEIQARYLADHPNSKVRLQGNTDDIGSREYNIGLGWRRDQSVSQILKQYGVRQDQIQMLSYGKERPARLGETESDRALNRRVELVYADN